LLRAAHCAAAQQAVQKNPADFPWLRASGAVSVFGFLNP